MGSMYMLAGGTDARRMAAQRVLGRSSNNRGLADVMRLNRAFFDSIDPQETLLYRSTAITIADWTSPLKAR
jgi:hypothetical protein